MLYFGIITKNMKIYIAYKFSNVQNKQVVREDVQTLSIILEDKGHKTYILGRDLQGWKDLTHPISSKMIHIIKNLREADYVVAYVNSSVFSKGLLFELIWAKILGKSVILAIREGISEKPVRFFANKTYVYKTIKDLENFEWTLN